MNIWILRGFYDQPEINSKDLLILELYGIIGLIIQDYVDSHSDRSYKFIDLATMINSNDFYHDIDFGSNHVTQHYRNP